MGNKSDSRTLSQSGKCCLNCRYSHQESYGLLCWGEKEPPLVPPDSVCDGWMPIEDPEGWRDIDQVGPPAVGEEVIICCKDGVMFFAKWHNNEQDGDYWIVRGPHDIRHYIKTNWVTHWRPKPKKPMN